MNIEITIHGIITSKPCDPYIKISDILNLMPKKIIPNFRIYFIENANPSL